MDLFNFITINPKEEKQAKTNVEFLDFISFISPPTEQAFSRAEYRRDELKEQQERLRIIKKEYQAEFKPKKFNIYESSVGNLNTIFKIVSRRKDNFEFKITKKFIDGNNSKKQIIQKYNKKELLKYLHAKTGIIKNIYKKYENLRMDIDRKNDLTRGEINYLIKKYGNDMKNAVENLLNKHYLIGEEEIRDAKEYLQTNPDISSTRLKSLKEFIENDPLDNEIKDLRYTTFKDLTKENLLFLSLSDDYQYFNYLYEFIIEDGNKKSSKYDTYVANSNNDIKCIEKIFIEKGILTEEESYNIKKQFSQEEQQIIQKFGFYQRHLKDYVEKAAILKQNRIITRVFNILGEEINKYSYYPEKYNAVNKLRFIQHNNHAEVLTTNKPPIKERNERIKKLSVPTNYYTDYELVDFIRQNVKTNTPFKSFFNITTKGYEIFEVYNSKERYLLKDDLIDRKFYPEVFTYKSLLFKQMKETMGAILHTRNHKLNNIIKQMPRKVIIGKFIELEQEKGGWDCELNQRHDLNNAYGSFEKCSFNAKNGEVLKIMPPIEYEETFYKCDNNIFKYSDLSGLMFVKNVRLDFLTPNCNGEIKGFPGVNHDDLINMLSLYNGQMPYNLARYIYENGQLECYGIIPSKTMTEEMLTKMQKYINDAKIDKSNRVSLIGKMISNKKYECLVITDRKELDYIISENEKCLTARISGEDDENELFLVQYEIKEADTNNKFPGKLCHIHHHIIGATQIRLLEQIKNLISQDSTIISIHTDCIEFSNDKFINAPEGWKNEHKDSCLRELIELNEEAYYTPSDAEFTDLSYEMMHKNRILINAPAGRGKTHFLNKEYPNALFSAFTHKAAKNYKGGITYEALKTMIERNKFIIMPKTIVIDEMSMLTVSDINEIEFLLSSINCTSRLILAGDFNQLPPIRLEGVAKEDFQPLYSNKHAINHYHDISRHFNFNYRAKEDPKLANLLDEMGININNKERFEEIKKQIFEYSLTISTQKDLNEIIKNNDCVFITRTNETKDDFARNYIKIKKITNPEIILKKNKKPYYNGQIGILKGRDAHFDCGIWKDIKRSFYNYYYSMTAYCCQGQTIKDKKIIIDANNLTDKKELYVSLSRATNSSQIVIFRP